MDKTNEQWISELKSSDSLVRDKAIIELHMLLIRGLFGAFKGNTKVSASTIEDAAQEAILKVVLKLDSFRGESKLLTWAMKIAIRIVYSEMRKAGWKVVSLDQVSEFGKPKIDEIEDISASGEKSVLQSQVIEKLWLAIEKGLTERQKTALLADFAANMPIEEIARKMNTNRNAIYKLLFDARQNLKKHLVSSNITLEDVKNAFE